MSETIRFPVAGMTCASCVSRITRALRKVAGVQRVKVDLGAETATVERDPLVASDSILSAAVVGAGYEPDLAAAVVVTNPPTTSGWLGRLLGRAS